jgi:hypothetical protein
MTTRFLKTSDTKEYSPRVFTKLFSVSTTRHDRNDITNFHLMVDSTCVNLKIVNFPYGEE